MNIPDELKWENAPFRGQPGTFQHSLVYVLGECLRAIKMYRDQTRPETVHCNVQLVLVGCAFFESAMSRGLVNAAQFRLRILPRTPEHTATRAELELCVKRLFDGKTYGSPISANGAAASLYGKAARTILGLDLNAAILADVAAGMRCLFLLRNIVVHGQTVTAAATFPDKFDDPLPQYQLRPTDTITELESYLRRHQLITPMTLKHGLGFPFLTDATLDHFLRRLVEYFRTLQDAIADQTLCHEFGGGLPQNHFPFFAGEHG